MLPQPLRYRQRVEVSSLPPQAFVAALMEFTMVGPAEWDSELIADSAPERAALRELKMMRVRRAAATGQAGLSAHEF